MRQKMCNAVRAALRVALGQRGLVKAVCVALQLARLEAVPQYEVDLRARVAWAQRRTCDSVHKLRAMARACTPRSGPTGLNRQARAAHDGLRRTLHYIVEVRGELVVRRVCLHVGMVLIAAVAPVVPSPRGLFHPPQECHRPSPLCEIRRLPGLFASLRGFYVVKTRFVFEFVDRRLQNTLNKKIKKN